MSISRRGFLQGMAAGTLAAGAAKGAGTKHFEGYEGRYGLLHDTTLCVGCRSCEFACNEVNGLPPPPDPINDKKVFDTKRRTTDELYTVVNRYVPAEDKRPPVYRKHQCMHCNEPCCASVCFVKAFTKTPEGPVLYDPDVCVGCRYCVFACPYYALAYEYDDPATPRVVRCTMCYPRIKKGLNPACAEACPTGAIQFGRREELLQVARKRIYKYPDRYIDHVFGEDEWGGTSWLTITDTDLEKLDLPESVPTKPLPTLTTGFLSLAPLAAAIIPGTLAGFYAFTRRREKHAEEELRKERERARAEQSRRLEEQQAAAERDAQRARPGALRDTAASSKEESHEPGK